VKGGREGKGNVPDPKQKSGCATVTDGTGSGFLTQDPTRPSRSVRSRSH